MITALQSAVLEQSAGYIRELSNEGENIIAHLLDVTAAELRLDNERHMDLVRFAERAMSDLDTTRIYFESFLKRLESELPDALAGLQTEITKIRADFGDRGPRTFPDSDVMATRAPGAAHWDHDIAGFGSEPVGTPVEVAGQEIHIPNVENAMDFAREMAGYEMPDIAPESALAIVPIATPPEKDAPKVDERPSPTFQPKACTACGLEFMPTGPTQDYCSDECRPFKAQTRLPQAATKICQNEGCGKAFDAKYADAKFCSTACTGAQKKREREAKAATESPPVEVIAKIAEAPPEKPKTIDIERDIDRRGRTKDTVRYVCGKLVEGIGNVRIARELMVEESAVIAIRRHLNDTCPGWPKAKTELEKDEVVKKAVGEWKYSTP